MLGLGSRGSEFKVPLRSDPVLQGSLGYREVYKDV